ncbi:MAG: sugar phosphate isomerase/epimerase [Christensenella sp.]|uniref:sugar phosphate isomerase/epimerase family protein n=1 Tax=Christensenella sp. TaxID=1935934 RepID=UPI002B21E1C5|nr:sugar phosphate isomerase/epimerase [Christensenella sp.]MEA5002341.1 sugar phosphate isomerase/epimerase [Christensenella sp.]
MKLSYNEATAANCSSLEKDLVLCEENGFDYIEMRGDMLLDYLMGHPAAVLKDFFGNSHLQPHAMNALYTYADMFHPQRANTSRDRALCAYFLACCETAYKIGGHYFIVVPHLLDDSGNIYLPHDPNTMPYPYDKEKVMEDSVRILRKLAAMAEQYEMNLAWEPVGSMGCAVRTARDAMEIIDATGCGNVGITLDPFNLYLDGKRNDFSDLARIPKEKIFAVHINNCDPLPLGTLDHCHRRFVDEGEIDLHNYLENIKKTGYDGMVSIETFRPEYYEMTPEDVIRTAYVTTKALVEGRL